MIARRSAGPPAATYFSNTRNVPTRFLPRLVPSHEQQIRTDGAVPLQRVLVDEGLEFDRRRHHFDGGAHDARVRGDLPAGVLRHREPTIGAGRPPEIPAIEHANTRWQRGAVVRQRDHVVNRCDPRAVHARDGWERRPHVHRRAVEHVDAVRRNRGRHREQAGMDRGELPGSSGSGRPPLHCARQPLGPGFARHAVGHHVDIANRRKPLHERARVLTHPRGQSGPPDPPSVDANSQCRHDTLLCTSSGNGIGNRSDTSK